MPLLDKLNAIATTRKTLLPAGVDPFNVVIEEIYSSTEASIDGHRVILAGTNNYLGLTFNQQCIDAGKAIGLTPWQRLIHVRLPTMFRIVLPSLSNTYISLFKDTSIASVIAVPELTYGAQWINFNTFRIIEVYAVVAPMYLVAGYTILFALQQLEKKFVVRR